MVLGNGSGITLSEEVCGGAIPCISDILTLSMRLKYDEILFQPLENCGIYNVKFKIYTGLVDFVSAATR